MANIAYSIFGSAARAQAIVVAPSMQLYKTVAAQLVVTKDKGDKSNLLTVTNQEVKDTPSELWSWGRAPCTHMLHLPCSHSLSHDILASIRLKNMHASNRQQRLVRSYTYTIVNSTKQI